MFLFSLNKSRFLPAVLLHRRCSSYGTVSTTLSLVGWVIVPFSVLHCKFLYLFFSFLSRGWMFNVIYIKNAKPKNSNQDSDNAQKSNLLAVWQAHVAMTLYKIALRIMISKLFTTFHLPLPSTCSLPPQVFCPKWVFTCPILHIYSARVEDSSYFR